jgi:ferritin-like metal-binding protein YciE
MLSEQGGMEKMAITNLEEKFIHQLGDIYDAEHQFLEAQQQQLKAASASALQTMLREHIGQTEQQIKTLEQVFACVGKPAKRIRCDGAAGLVKEGEKSMEEASEPALRDCLIAGSANKVEHYEIVAYRGLVALAQHLGQREAAMLLRQNLLQEEQTAQRIEQSEPSLMKLAERAQERGG